MENNMEYHHIKEFFSSLLVLSVSKNKHTMFKFKEENWLYEAGYIDVFFNSQGMHNTVTYIADDLFEKGISYIYCEVVEKKGKKGFIFETINDKKTLKKLNKKNIFKIKIPFLKRLKVKSIRRKINSIEKYRHSNDFDTRQKYIIEQEKYKDFAIAKLVHNFYIDAYKTELYNDYYYTLKLINTRIKQLNFVEFIIQKINLIIEDVAEVVEYISFNGFSFDELNELKEELENNKISINDAFDKLYDKKLI